MLPLYVASFFVASTIFRHNHIVRVPIEDKIANEFTDLTVEVVEPGLVIIRNFLSEDEQKRMAKCALKYGSDDDKGFYKIDNITGETKLNADETRGRIYDAITRFPKWVEAYASTACEFARKADTSIQKMLCTHLSLNMYTSTNGLVCHRDTFENDAQSNHPVINFCIGASCRFGLRRNNDEPSIEGNTDREIILRSGDVLIFNERCRYMKHAILDGILDDCPEWMEIPCRFSFTFRKSSEAFVREDKVRYFKVKDHMVAQDDMKNFARSKTQSGDIPVQKLYRRPRAFVQ